MASALNTPLEALAAKEAIVLATVAPLADLLARLERLPAGASGVAHAMLTSPDLSRLREALQAGAAWRTLRDELEPVFVETAFVHPLGGLRSPLVAGTRSFFARWGGAYRRASRELAGLLRGPLP
jgi:hypothetical protein